MSGSPAPTCSGRKVPGVGPIGIDVTGWPSSCWTIAEPFGQGQFASNQPGLAPKIAPGYALTSVVPLGHFHDVRQLMLPAASTGPIPYCDSKVDPFRPPYAPRVKPPGFQGLSSIQYRVPFGPVCRMF